MQHPTEIEDLQQSPIEGTQEENLVSNTEILQRQMYYLSTVRTYLEQQLQQVNEALQKQSEKLNKLNS